MEFNYDLNDPPPSDNDEPDGRWYSDIHDIGNFFSRTNRTERANRLRAWGFRIPNLPVALVEQNLQLRGDQPAIHSVSVAPVEQNLQLWGDRLMSIPVPVAPVEQNLQLWGDRLMTTIPVPVAPVEQNLQPQPEPIDVVEVDSEEEEEEEDEDDGDEFYDYLIDEEDDDVEEVVAAAVNDEIIISSSSTVGQASSSTITHGRSPLNGSGSAQIADNQQRDKRRRGDPQQVVNVHNINARLQELIAPPPTQASTEVCPTCKGASGASSSKPKPVALPPPPPPPPTYKCPICMGPLVDPVVFLDARFVENVANPGWVRFKEINLNLSGCTLLACNSICRFYGSFRISGNAKSSLVS
ncbi:hypothetical protein QVD17_22336 [Tagetes erecta]|uniref:Uncharacterized protein n=1 Tax=Tagetes erecta TaxID=13708 RepID=A0AAD8KDD4_TARER|nr:hypothetical protein QVD17_22336 [Tagetes erecta]